MSASRAGEPAVRLEAPSARWHQSWLDGIAEFGDVANIDGAGLTAKPDLHALADPAAFAAFVERLRADALEETDRPAGWVPSTIVWIIAEDRYVGTLSIRHRLTPALIEFGGHIGTSVIPSVRRRGYARAAAQQALPLVRQLGIPRILVTAYEDNMASRRLIEAMIASFGLSVEQDVVGGTRRFWIQVPSA